MTPLPCCLLVAAFIAAVTPCLAEVPALTLEAAERQAGLRCEMTSNGRDQFALAIINTTGAEVRIDVPAGLICATPGGERIILLRGAQVRVSTGAAWDAQFPIAALSSKSASAAQPCQATNETETRLAPLLAYLATRPDVPRATSQLVTLALVENIAFAAWQQFLAPQSPAPHPTPAQVTQAIDALGILREIAPEKTFVLFTDAELKLRALRNPWSRAKAMQLYGVTLPDDAAVPGTAPDLGQLLHTKAGDNCPVCRLRQPPENDW